jgi:hypothetical protein
MIMPKACIMCPENDKTKCFECWKKKVIAGEIILSKEEQKIFDREMLKGV